MDQQQLKEKIRAIIGKGMHLASLATITDGKPWVRYVTVWCDDDLNFLFATFLSSRKVLQMKAVPDVHLTFHITRDGKPAGPFFQVAGQGEILTDPELLAASWHPAFERYFPKGAEDPDYCIARIVPERIEMESDPGTPAAVLEFQETGS